MNPRFEQEYTESSLSAIPAGDKVIETDDGTSPNDNVKRAGAHTPVTMQAGDGTYLSVHESNLEATRRWRLPHSPTAGQRDGRRPDPAAGRQQGVGVGPTRHAVANVQLGTSPSDRANRQPDPLLADRLDGSVFPTNSVGTPSEADNGRRTALARHIAGNTNSSTRRPRQQYHQVTRDVSTNGRFRSG